jgi:hypothetical protein
MKLSAAQQRLRYVHRPIVDILIARVSSFKSETGAADSHREAQGPERMPDMPSALDIQSQKEVRMDTAVATPRSV